MYLLSWRKTNFLCITSILSPKSMSKLINVNCLHFIGCQNYTNVLINRVLYQIQVTALLPFFLRKLHLLLQLSKIMLWSTVKLLLAIVMSIIFGPLKTLPRSSKSCDCVTFRVLKYLLSTFLLYTPHCHIILSKQKCCLWSTGVSTENQNLTSVLHLKLYCRYLYTRPCMINHIWGLKQLWLQVNGHAWFHLQRLRWPVRNGEGAKNSKWKYMSPAGFEPTPRQSTTGKLQRLRPLGHEGLMVISG